MSESKSSANTASTPFAGLPWGLPAGLNPLSRGASSVPGLDEISNFMRQAWASMNLNMLRGSIQALEVQRATVATFRAFSEAAMSPPGQSAAAAATEARQAAQPGKAHDPASQTPQDARVSNDSGGAARPAQHTGTNSKAAAPAEPMLEAATAWWQMLNTQFEQVSQAALNASGSTGQPPTKSARGKPRTPKAGAAARSTRKPRGSPS
jgi:hypothetical protein